MTVRVRRAETDAEREDALSVRHEVFVEEQGVPEAIELDGEDDEAIHLVGYATGESVAGTAADGEFEPVAAARLREVGDGESVDDERVGDAERVGKVERVAVLRSHRGDGVGRAVMDELEATAADRGLSTLRMHAQTPVEGFYRKLGYETTSEVFEEAGIAHVEMEKSLD